MCPLARRKGLSAGAICTVDGTLVKGTQKGTATEDESLPEKAKNNVWRALDISLDAVRALTQEADSVVVRPTTRQEPE